MFATSWVSRPARVILLALFLLPPVLSWTPAPAHAIPTAGDYTFTSGFTGTFTSNGNALTVWTFTVPSTVVLWTDSEPSVNPPITNDSLVFSAQTQAGFIKIDWSSNSFTARINLINGPPTDFAGPFGYQRATTGAVPEPSTALLAGLGLLLVLGYGWRQRRQAGLQIR